MHDPLQLAGNTDRPNLYWGVDLPGADWGVRDRHLQAVLATRGEEDQAIIYATFTRT